MNEVLQIENLNKKYKLYRKPWHFGVELLTFGRKKMHDDFWALNDINLKVDKGRCLGIIGPNGAGKSTLLKIIAGTSIPTSGSCQIKGRVVSLLELGTGINPLLTGRENIYQSGLLLGMTIAELRTKEASIVEFADIGQYIDYPVRTYSSGMYVRIAFSIFAHMEPDLYVVDEALAVGDLRFQQKCYKRMEELSASGCAILFVSHDLPAVLKFCTETILMERGRIIKTGSPHEVVPFYTGGVSMSRPKPSVPTLADNLPDTANPERDRVRKFGGKRHGSRKVEIIGVSALDLAGNHRDAFAPNETIRLRMEIIANEDTENFTPGYLISNRFGEIIFGQNLYMADRQRLSLKKGQTLIAESTFPCSLFDGQYMVTLTLTDCATVMCEECYDMMENCFTWTIYEPAWRFYYGIMSMPTQWKITGGTSNLTDGTSKADKTTIT